jgi:hypothetical protein
MSTSVARVSLCDVQGELISMSCTLALLLTMVDLMTLLTPANHLCTTAGRGHA